jgi:hypothetical protein
MFFIPSTEFGLWLVGGVGRWTLGASISYLRRFDGAEMILSRRSKDKVALFFNTLVPCADDITLNNEMHN